MGKDLDDPSGIDTEEACGENGDRLSEDLRSSAWEKDRACIYRPADSGAGRQYGRV